MATSAENEDHPLPLHTDHDGSSTKSQNTTTKLRDLIQDHNGSKQVKMVVSSGRHAIDVLVTALVTEYYDYTVSSSFPSLILQSSTSDEVTIGIIPLDLLAWDLWMPWNTLTVCAIGTPSANTFFEMAYNRVLDSKEKITIVNANKSSATLELCIAPYKVLLKYHSNPLVAKWSEIKENALADIKSTLPWTSQERIDELIETQEIATKLEQYDTDLLRGSYWQYLRWAVYLGLHPILLDSGHIISLAIWALDKDIDRTDFDRLNLPVPVTGKEVEDVAAKLGFGGSKWEAWRLQTIHHMAGRIIRRDGQSSPVNHTATHSRSRGFYRAWPWYVRVDLNYWGSSSIQASQWVAKVESSLKAITLSCSKDTSLGARFHLWPHPFSSDDDADLNEPSLEDDCDAMKFSGPYQESNVSQTDFDYMYFVGISGLEDENKFDTASIYSRFAESLRTLAGPDCSCSVVIIPQQRMWLDWYSTIFRRIAVPIDPRKLGITDTQLDKSPTKTPCSAPRRIKKPIALQRHYNKPPSPPQPSSEPKSSLRPAIDVLNRLRHDSRFNTDDYLVGYLDRHAGVQELPVEQWVAENTDEAFIPQSRIRYFKRKTDGVLVWDRLSRIDRVFGSGKQDEQPDKGSDQEQK